MLETYLAELLQGVPASSIIAAFSGSISALVIHPPMPLARAFLAVFAGVSAAIYLSPVAIHLSALPEWAHNVVVYLGGVTGVKVLPVIAGIIEKVIVSLTDRYLSDKGR